MVDPMPCPPELHVDGVAGVGEDRADRVRGVTEARSGVGGGDARRQGPFGCGDEGDALRRGRVADGEADGGVRGDAVEHDGEVQSEEVAVLEGVLVGEPVRDRVVDGGADAVAEGASTEGGVVVDVAVRGAGFEDHRLGQSPESSAAGGLHSQ
jgi:hypothetical protein